MIPVFVVDELNHIAGTHHNGIKVEVTDCYGVDICPLRCSSLVHSNKPYSSISFHYVVFHTVQHNQAKTLILPDHHGILFIVHLENVQKFRQVNWSTEGSLVICVPVDFEICRDPVVQEASSRISIIRPLVEGHSGRCPRHLRVSLRKVRSHPGSAPIQGNLVSTGRKENGARIEDKTIQGIQRNSALPKLQFLGFSRSQSDTGPLIFAVAIAYGKFRYDLDVTREGVGASSQNQVLNAIRHLTRVGDSRLHAEGTPRNRLALGHGLGNGLVVVLGNGLRLIFSQGMALTLGITTVITPIHHELPAIAGVTRRKTNVPSVHQGGAFRFAEADALGILHRFPFGNGDSLRGVGTGGAVQRYAGGHGHGDFQLGKIRHVGVPNRGIFGIEEFEEFLAIFKTVAIGILGIGIGLELEDFIVIRNAVLVAV